jgi:RNA recognition motif-containing protein
MSTWCVGTTVVYADVMKEGGSGGRSRGCGIVEFETAEEAAAAINTLNDVELDGRPIFVREDREDRDLVHTPHPTHDPTRIERGVVPPTVVRVSEVHTEELPTEAHCPRQASFPLTPHTSAPFAWLHS